MRRLTHQTSPQATHCVAHGDGSVGYGAKTVPNPPYIIF